LAQCNPSWLVNGFIGDSGAVQRAIFAHDAPRQSGPLAQHVTW
jgi:hypothetical protein